MRALDRLCILAGFTLIVPSPAPAHACTDYSQGMRWTAGWNMQHYVPGYGNSDVQTLARGGAGVFAADDDGAIIAWQELSPGSLVRRGGLNRTAFGLDATTNRLYVAHGSGLSIVNTTNLGNLVVIADVSVPASGNLDVDGQYAYVASSDRLTIVKVSEPAPSVMGSLFGETSDVAVRGARAYVMASNELKVVNVSNPNLPTLVNTLNVGSQNTMIAISGSYLYLSELNSGLRIFSLSNQDLPTEVAFVPASDCSGVSVDNGIALLFTNTGMQYIDVHDPTQPAVRGHDGSLYLRRAVFSGQFAYVAASSNGLEVVNLGDGTNVAPEVTSPILAKGVDLATTGHYVVAMQYPNLTVTDVQNPLAPVQVGSVAVSGEMRVQGSYAYVATDSGLKVIDLSTPSSPTIIAELEDVPTGHLQIDGGRAYIVPELSFEVWTVDISNPAAPVLMGTGELSIWAYASCAGGGALYAADGFEFHSNVAKWDMTDPTNPVLVAVVTMPAVSSLQVSGSRLLVGCGSTLYSLRASDLHDQRSIGDHRFAVNLALAPLDRILGWNSGGGFSVLSGTTQPQYLGSGSTNSGSISDVLEVGGYVYATVAGGVEIFALPCDTADVTPVAADTSPAIHAFPSPFSGTTTFTFASPVSARAELALFDATGRLVRRLASKSSVGRQSIEWDGRDEAGRPLPSGVYFARSASTGGTSFAKVQIVR